MKLEPLRRQQTIDELILVLTVSFHEASHQSTDQFTRVASLKQSHPRLRYVFKWRVDDGLVVILDDEVSLFPLLDQETLDFIEMIEPIDIEEPEDFEPHHDDFLYGHLSALVLLPSQYLISHIKVLQADHISVSIVIGNGAACRDSTQHVHTFQHRIQNRPTHVVCNSGE